MSENSLTLPQHLDISEISVKDGAQAFAGINLGSIKFGNATSRQDLTNTVDQALEKLQVTTDPRIDKSRIEYYNAPYNGASCRWIFDNIDFQAWRDSPESRLLWIKGDAGKGKTMLLFGIINEMLRQKKQPEESDGRAVLLTYFFCQRDDSRINNAMALLRGLIYLLAVQQKELLKRLTGDYYIKVSDNPDDPNVIFALGEILMNMLLDTKETVYLIVDALDVCEGRGLEPLLGQIVRTTAACQNVRWLVSSRDNSLINDGIRLEDGAGRFQIELNDRNMAPAVDIYIDAKLSDFEWLKGDAMLRDQVRAKIRQKAKATFLWVSLICNELKVEDGSTALRVLEDAPAHLSDMKARSRACTFLKAGYGKFEQFKKNKEHKDHKLLLQAIGLCQDAMVEAMKPTPRYNRGLLRAYISLAECHLELSHSYNPLPPAKSNVEHMKEAERCIERALELGEEIGDERRADRARFVEALLRARWVLVEMKQTNSNPDARRDLRDRLCAARATIVGFKERYDMADNKKFVRSADKWLGRLDTAMEKLE